NGCVLFPARGECYPPLHEGCGTHNAKRNFSPNHQLVDRRDFHKVTGKVTKLGPSIDVGAIEAEKLTDELVVPMGGLKVAIQLPEELQSAGRLKFDFVDGSFVLARDCFPNSVVLLICWPG